MAVALDNSRRSLRPSGAPSRKRSPRPNLVVIEQQKRRVSKSVKVITSVLLVMFAVVGLRIYMAQQQVKLDQLNQDVTKARQYFDQLRAERSQLQSPSVLLEQARALGMEPAVKIKIIAVSPDAAAAVAATVGEVDESFRGPVTSPLVQFGEMKSRVGLTP